MRYGRPLRSLAIAIGLAACSTPYQATFLTGGYTERDLGGNVWRVEFEGNGFTTQETVQTYWLYRSAQLTLDKGYDGFEIISSTSLARAEPAPVQVAAASGAHYTYHPVYIPMYTGGDSGPKPTVVGDIRLLKAPIQPKPPKVFDATQLKTTLEPYVNGKKCDMGNVCSHAHLYLRPDTETASAAASLSAGSPAPQPAAPSAAPVAAAPSSPPAPQTVPAAAPAAAAPTPAPGPQAIEQPVSSVDFHCPQPGLLIRTSTGEQLRFTEANGERCSYVDKNGDTRERYALFVDGFGQAAKSNLDRLWPLRVGNRVEYDVVDTTPVQPTDRFSQRHYHESFQVLRQERISVPAGAFDTFVVEWDEMQIGLHHDKNAAKITLWYAPRVGYFVKSAADIVNANATDPFAAAQYASASYQAAEIVLPDGKVPSADTKTPAKAAPAAPSTATTPAASSSQSPADRLITLKRLLDEKLITREEYDTRRKAILDGL